MRSLDTSFFSGKEYCKEGGMTIFYFFIIITKSHDLLHLRGKNARKHVQIVIVLDKFFVVAKLPF